jgi:hypothetical protein
VPSCVVCQAAGRSTAAHFIVTVYTDVATPERTIPACPAHAMVEAVSALAAGHGVWALTAQRGGMPDIVSPTASITEPRGPVPPWPAPWLRRLRNPLRRLRRGASLA